MDEQNFGLRDILDLYVYDDKDNLIASLTSLKSAKIKTDNDATKLLCCDALYNLNLLQFVYGEGSVANNFNDTLDQLMGKVVNKFSKLNFKGEECNKKVKLIGKTVFRNAFTNKDHNVIIYAKNAILKRCSNFNFTCDRDPAENIVEFELLPDENKDTYVVLFQN